VSVGPRRWGLLAGVVAGVVLLIAVGLSTGGSAPRTPGPGSSTTGTSTAATTSSQVIPGKPAPAGEQFGINVNRLFDDGTYSQAQIAGQLRALAATGTTVARSDALWEASEPNPPVAGAHRYSWSFDDRIAASLAAEGLTWLPILDYTAPWAESVPGQDHSPPRLAADYAAYAGAFAARYGSDGTFWRAHPTLPARPVSTYEIWNEPDNSEFWLPTPVAGAYADLYLAARDAILAADPRARAIVGGLTHPDSFLPAMLAALPALRGQLDGVAVHPYGNPLVVLGKLRSDRSTLNRLGLASVPLYVSEFGWTTSPPGTLNYAPSATRPRYIEATMDALGHLDCGVAAAILYTWVTPQRNPADREDWYGIHGPTGTPTSSSEAFSRGLRRATEPAPEVPLCAAARR
jgi:hypothetical protein